MFYLSCSCFVVFVSGLLVHFLLIYFLLEVFMAKRSKVSKHGSRKLFSHTAKGTHRKNTMNAVVMRGGIRL